MFLIGVRNIPRRRAQTVLIVIGLMLSTLIISAAFSIGDTVNYSITNQVYNTLHSIDEIVQVHTGSSNKRLRVSPGASRAADPAGAGGPVGAGVQVDRRRRRRRAGDSGTAPIADRARGQSERSITVAGADAGIDAGLPGHHQHGRASSSRSRTSAPDEVYMNSSLADKLDAHARRQLTVFVGGQPTQFIAEGHRQGHDAHRHSASAAPEGLAMPLARAQTLFNRPNEVDFIAVSNDGGVRDSLGEQRRSQRRPQPEAGRRRRDAWRATDDEAGPRRLTRPRPRAS